MNTLRNDLMSTPEPQEKIERMGLIVKITLTTWLITLLSYFEVIFLNLTPEKYDLIPILIWLISFVGSILATIIFVRENKKFQSMNNEICSVEGCENKTNFPMNEKVCVKHDQTYKTNLRRNRLSVIPLIIFMIYWFFIR
jgi:hypothetical protein